MATSPSTQHWLLKAEPESRLVKGKDVKFSIDDFEHVGSSPWEGVRNHEAKNIMKQMKVGDKVLFYHSSCKVPGVAGFAQVSKEAYPDYTAWDPDHPYYDEKSKSDDPRWFMVDLTFGSRAKNFVSLSLLRYIADLPNNTPPKEMEYIGEGGIAAIKEMDLVRRGRLSVQRVTPEAYSAVLALAEQGGWDGIDTKTSGSGKAKAKPKAKKLGGDEEEKGRAVKPARGTKSAKRSTKGKANAELVSDPESSPLSELEDEEEPPAPPKKASSRKRKAPGKDDTKEDNAPPRRRSRRIQQ